MHLPGKEQSALFRPANYLEHNTNRADGEVPPAGWPAAGGCAGRPPGGCRAIEYFLHSFNALKIIPLQETRCDEWRTSSPQSSLELPIFRIRKFASPIDTMGLPGTSSGRDSLVMPVPWGEVTRTDSSSMTPDARTRVPLLKAGQTLFRWTPSGDLGRISDGEERGLMPREGRLRREVMRR
ncbi:hypothetical protein EVAR_23211_1 [Eumeta japonica]|uniref:Uncharacterized protein n=1 Tax=Eumeta variegata TaxID=151549 RepID=A0A4C1VE75_EUMVA|nr:hypothetical protein EVAR_23211_1 [Eumeta japonica]